MWNVTSHVQAAFKIDCAKNKLSFRAFMISYASVFQQYKFHFLVGIILKLKVAV